MFHELSEIDSAVDGFAGEEATVRCQVRSDPMRGDREGTKTMYKVGDPRGEVSRPSFVSFWEDEKPGVPGASRTSSYVLETMSGGPHSTPLNHGEEILVRGIPNEYEGKLYINATSAIIRSPGLRVGKSEMRNRENCPREYYLRYIKSVYQPSRDLVRAFFKGDVTHRAFERALDERRQDFVEGDWTEDSVEEFVLDVVDEEFSMRSAQFTLACEGLGSARENAVENATNLFCDEIFQRIVRDADEVETEWTLPAFYGFNGRVDAVLDGRPYDLKTTYEVDDDDVDRHSLQLKLYIFGMLLNRLEPGDRLSDEVNESPAGYILYSNPKGRDEPRIEEVRLTEDDVDRFIRLRNQVAGARNRFGVPSTYGRECDGCSFRDGDAVDVDGGEVLPSACKYHCQTERRWPCYETTESGEVESDCSLFQECEQRFEFYDPSTTDHYNSLRSALRKERKTREVASDIFERMDEDRMEACGRLLRNLSLTGAEKRTVAKYGSEAETPPISEVGEGDTVILTTQGDSGERYEAVFYGRRDEDYLFKFDDNIPRELLNPDKRYKAIYSSDPEEVSRKHLPYLDFAQRKGYDPTVSADGEKGSDTSLLNADEVHEVANHLDRDEVLVDVPVRRDRTETVQKICISIADAEYPLPEDDGYIPEAARRCLFLCSDPETLEEIHDELSEKSRHIRMDGTAGEAAVHDGMSQHEIAQSLGGANSVVSSIHYALETEVFGSLEEGGPFKVDDVEYEDRTHSENFFDVMVVVGAESVPKPAQLFLTDVADRQVLIGDTRSTGPEMLSEEAAEEGLSKSYFSRTYDRNRYVPEEGTSTIRIQGESTEATELLVGGEGGEPEEWWTDIDGTYNFSHVDGEEKRDVGKHVIRATARCVEGVGKKLVFESNRGGDIFSIRSSFDELDELDATRLSEDEVYRIAGHRLLLTDKSSTEDTGSENHVIEIEVDTSRTQHLTGSLLYNPEEAERAARISGKEDPDVVITPYVTQANEINKRLDDEVDTDVKLPGDLDGNIHEKAVVSLVVSNDEGVIRPPLSDPEILYRILSAAESSIFVGNKDTLTSKDILKELIDEALM